MKDNSMETREQIPNNPLPFTLERELTLMPNEFRERLSASHLRSRRSTAQRRERRSANTQSTRGRHKPNRDTVKEDSAVTQSNMHGASHYHRDPEEDKEDCDNQEELESFTAHIPFDDGKSMSLHIPISEYGDSSDPSERLYSVQTPVNLHIRDIMAPLEEWGSREAIREKKYTVLPSINKPNASPTRTINSKTPSSSLLSQSHELSIFNQLDYGREKMEEEADFFADYRINTSLVQATPRQNPLPPIKHGEEGGQSVEHVSNPFLVNKRHSTNSSKRREKLLLLQQ